MCKYTDKSLINITDSRGLFPDLYVNLSTITGDWQ